MTTQTPKFTLEQLIAANVPQEIIDQMMMKVLLPKDQCKGRSETLTLPAKTAKGEDYPYEKTYGIWNADLAGMMTELQAKLEELHHDGTRCYACQIYDTPVSDVHGARIYHATISVYTEKKSQDKLAHAKTYESLTKSW